MNPRPDPQTGMQEDELLRLIGALENGTLTDEGNHELSLALEYSPRARQLYFEYFKLSALLRAEAETRERDGTMPVLNGRGQQRRTFRHSLLAAAAVIAALVTVGALVVPRNSGERIRLTAAGGSNWSVTSDKGRDEEAGTGLGKGDTLRLASGTVSLTGKDGPQLLVQGPAIIRFPELDQPVLERGWLWVDSAATDSPLSVATPGLTFRDIGTRFGVRVRDDHRSELHLVEGIVEVQDEGGGAVTRITSAATGYLISADGGTEKLPVAADPFPGLAALLESHASYATTVMSQAPCGYWRLDESSGEQGANLASGGSIAKFDVGVVLDVQGVRPADGFPGFQDDNSGAGLPGQSERSVIHTIDSPAGVTAEEGAVAFWLRRDPDLSSAEILWWAGMATPAAERLRHEILTALTESGQVELFIENGESDVRLFSERSAADGRWHHIVASWCPREVELYLDGRLVARDGAPRVTEGPFIRNRHVRFGKKGPLDGDQLSHYRGEVDEIALWNRRLTAAEIGIQFRAARERSSTPPPSPDNE